MRPPFDGDGIKTTYSNDPGDNRDMLVWLSDQVNRLIRQVREPSDQAALSRVLSWVRLFDIRERWILGEMQAEEFLSGDSAAPLGLDVDSFDLTLLDEAGASTRRWQYQRLLEQVRLAKAELLGELGDPITDSNPS